MKTSIDNSERTLLYLENGDDYKGDNYTLKEAKKYLKENGYYAAYSGRKFNKYGIKVLVGYNNNNTIFLDDRKKNGLYRAAIISL